MALTYDQISAITEKKFIPKLVDNIFDSDPLLQRAKSKGWYRKIDGGTQVLMPLNYALNGSGGWYSGAETLDTTDTENITAADYAWKQLYENISITRRDELKNSGDAQKLDFVKSKVQIAEKSMKDRLGDGLYSNATDSKSIVGLDYALETANTIGGIDQSSYSWWQAQVDSTTTTLTISAMQTVFNNCSINNEHPTVAMATRANYNRYYALLQPQQRFMDESTAKGGFSSLMFNGIPFISGAKVPTGDVMFINENYIHLLAHKDEDMRFEKFQKPVNQNVKVAKLYWMGVLAFDNLRMHGTLNAITA